LHGELSGALNGLPLGVASLRVAKHFLIAHFTGAAKAALAAGASANSLASAQA